MSITGGSITHMNFSKIFVAPLPRASPIS
jgi:hypothetical protein